MGDVIMGRGSVVSVVRSWPAPLNRAALIGPIGEAVELIAPHTESDPAAILLQLLTGFGNLIDRGAHWRVEADDHYANLDTALVGRTSSGRKGTSWGQARAILKAVDPVWDADRQLSGLSSGEGLIAAVQDHEDRPDKRLMVVEPEFARVLKNARRDGNILSPVIRQAWDGGTLRVATRNAPLSAKGAHISIIAHITEEELRTELGKTEAFNGFANRFLWTCVQRSQRLPFGGRFQEENIAVLVRRLRASAGHARKAGRVGMTSSAERLWEASYDALTEERLGMYGAATGRAEPQTMRLALIYALTEERGAIEEHHLRAALEVWRYCCDSALYLFGGSIGNDIADAILALVDERGRATRTEIRDMLGRNVLAARINGALELLCQHELLELVPRDVTRPGRPPETYRRPIRPNDQTSGAHGLAPDSTSGRRRADERP